MAEYQDQNQEVKVAVQLTIIIIIIIMDYCCLGWNVTHYSLLTNKVLTQLGAFLGMTDGKGGWRRL